MCAEYKIAAIASQSDCVSIGCDADIFGFRALRYSAKSCTAILESRNVFGSCMAMISWLSGVLPDDTDCALVLPT